MKHGNFADMELEVRKLSRQSARNKLEGGWHTAVSLKHEKNWTEPLACLELLHVTAEGHDQAQQAVGNGQGPELHSEE